MEFNRCAQFPTGIFLRQIGLFSSNFISSIIWLGKKADFCFHILTLIGKMSRRPCHLFELIFFILAGNEDNHKNSHGFGFRLNGLFKTTCHLVMKCFQQTDTCYEEKVVTVQVPSFLTDDLLILVGNEVSGNSLYEFDFCRDRTIHIGVI